VVEYLADGRECDDMRNQAESKLRSQRGVTLLIAMLLFLACTMATSVVLAASTTSSGRLAELAEADQRYYSVSSAVEFFQDMMGEGRETITQSRKVTHTETKADDGSIVSSDEQDYAESDITFRSEGFANADNLCASLSSLLVYGKKLSEASKTDVTDTQTTIYEGKYETSAQREEEWESFEDLTRGATGYPTLDDLLEKRSLESMELQMDFDGEPDDSQLPVRITIESMNRRTGETRVSFRSIPQPGDDAGAPQTSMTLVLSADIDAYSDHEDLGAEEGESFLVDKDKGIGYTDVYTETLYCNIVWTVVRVETGAS
jgi:hypothetical protein